MISIVIICLRLCIALAYCFVTYFNLEACMACLCGKDFLGGEPPASPTLKNKSREQIIYIILSVFFAAKIAKRRPNV